MATETTSTEIHRRKLLFRLFSCLAGLSAALTGLPAAAFLLGPLRARREAGAWVRLAALEEVSQDGPVAMALRHQVRDAWEMTTRRSLVFLSRSGGQWQALSAVCTHLGCNVDWSGADAAFVCPCHGGRFAADGTVVAGPPRRRLEKLPVKEDSGYLWVMPPGSKPEEGPV